MAVQLLSWSQDLAILQLLFVQRLTRPRIIFGYFQLNRTGKRMISKTEKLQSTSGIKGSEVAANAEVPE